MYSISPSPLSLSLSLFGIVGSRAHFIVPPLSRVALELSDARCNALNSPSLSLSLSLSERAPRAALRLRCEGPERAINKTPFTLKRYSGSTERAGHGYFITA